jgi:triosephosphate isomerase
MKMARRPLIAGNWKMNKTIAETRALLGALAQRHLPPGTDVVVCPPFTALAAASEVLAGTSIGLGAQTMHESKSGAFTGEISAGMLRELGVTYVILGHSERRQYNGETDAAIKHKVHAALENGITPIVAVGETAHEYEAGFTIAKVEHQTRAALFGLSPKDVAKCVIAYEPIWAIGTGLVDSPENANVTMGHIRASVEGLAEARILYGGSMKGDNAAALMAQEHIDGGLIGGASLTADAFEAVILAAVRGLAQR